MWPANQPAAWALTPAGMGRKQAHAFTENLLYPCAILTLKASSSGRSGTYWPRTGEGRALCFLLAPYGFAVFGCFTATLATFFMGRDAKNPRAEVAGAAAVAALHEEVRQLRAELRQRPFPTDSTASKQPNE